MQIDEFQIFEIASGGEVFGPFQARMLFPLLLSIFPVQCRALAAQAILIACFAATATYFCKLMVLYDVQRRYRVLGLGLLTLSAVCKPAICSSLIHDTLATMFALMAIYYAKCEKYDLVACVLVVGVLAKESVLAVVPCLWFLYPRVFISTLPACVVFIAIRWMIGGWVREYSDAFDPTRLLSKFWGHKWATAIWLQMIRACGVCWILAIFPTGRKILKDYWIFILCMAIQWTAAADVSRLILPVYPVIILAAVVAYSKLKLYQWCDLALIAVQGIVYVDGAMIGRW